jgi:hypothetical protein
MSQKLNPLRISQPLQTRIIRSSRRQRTPPQRYPKTIQVYNSATAISIRANVACLDNAIASTINLKRTYKRLPSLMISLFGQLALRFEVDPYCSLHTPKFPNRATMIPRFSIHFVFVLVNLLGYISLAGKASCMLGLTYMPNAGSQGRSDARGRGYVGTSSIFNTRITFQVSRCNRPLSFRCCLFCSSTSMLAPFAG